MLDKEGTALAPEFYLRLYCILGADYHRQLRENKQNSY